MKEPVYECEACGKTLEKWQQGRFLWCATCMRIWDDGFYKGIRNHDAMMEVNDILEGADVHDKVAPYLVKE